jgi:hypothetical protein
MQHLFHTAGLDVVGLQRCVELQVVDPLFGKHGEAQVGAHLERIRLIGLEQQHLVEHLDGGLDAPLVGELLRQDELFGDRGHRVAELEQQIAQLFAQRVRGAQVAEPVAQKRDRLPGPPGIAQPFGFVEQTSGAALLLRRVPGREHRRVRRRHAHMLDVPLGDLEDLVHRVDGVVEHHVALDGGDLDFDVVLARILRRRALQLPHERILRSALFQDHHQLLEGRLVAGLARDARRFLEHLDGLLRLVDLVESGGECSQRVEVLGVGLERDL